jgi:hypothetical protein
MDEEEKVVVLPGSPTAEAPKPRAHMNPLHTLATTGMAVSALIGIGALLTFISVGWPGNARRYVIAVLVLAAVAFLACASIAVFVAARETYPHGGERRER